MSDADEPKKSAKLDEFAYREGADAFRRGVPIRTMVEQNMAAEGSTALELAAFSFAVGYTDAFLELLRNLLAKPPVIVTPHIDADRSLDGRVVVGGQD